MDVTVNHVFAPTTTLTYNYNLPVSDLISWCFKQVNERVLSDTIFYRAKHHKMPPSPDLKGKEINILEEDLTSQALYLPKSAKGLLEACQLSFISRSDVTFTSNKIEKMGGVFKILRGLSISGCYWTQSKSKYTLRTLRQARSQWGFRGFR